MEANLNVILKQHTPNPEQVIADSAKVCYSKKDSTVENPQKLIENLSKKGHTSPFEHAFFSFFIEGISRACSHQLVRHRIASYTQASQRYVNETSFDYIVPPKIKDNPEALKLFIEHMASCQETYKKLMVIGILKEDARYILPEATETKLTVTINARSLLNFFSLRLAKEAQWEIRRMAYRILDIVKSLIPNIVKGFLNEENTQKI